MIKYFIYCRKSSEGEERQALSIDAQISEMTAIARAHGLTLVECLTESKSAKDPGRPVFNEMLRRIECGEANAILTWKLDRLARNFDDGGKIVGLLQRGVIKEIRAFEKTYLPSDNVLLMAVELGMANQYVRDLSVNIKRGLREKVKRGVYPLKAPMGYINHPKLRQLEPHPEKFEKLRKILELFATGNYTLAQIQREFAKADLVGELSKRPPPIASIDKLLRHHIYYGVFFYDGVLHQGIHKPMISKETFDRIQKVRVAVGKGSKKFDEKGFRFLNFARCGSCGYCITAERHTKKSGKCYAYYRCTHKNKLTHCEDRAFVSAERFAAEVKRNAQLIALPDVWKERYLARIETWESEEAGNARAEVDALRIGLESVRKKIDQLNAGFIEGSIELGEMRELKNPLVLKKVELEAQIDALTKKRTVRLEPLRNWVISANAIGNAALREDWDEMRKTLQNAGSNPILRAQTLHVSFLKPWNLLAEMNSATTTLAPLCGENEKWWR